MTRTPSSGPGISDHPPVTKLEKFVAVVAQRQQYLLGVGAGTRPGPFYRSRSPFEEDRHPQLSRGADLGILYFYDSSSSQQLGMREMLVRRQDGLCSQPGGVVFLD
jgi:hypothetical protein